MMSLTSYRYPTMFMCPTMVPYASLEIVRSISKYNFPSSWLKMTLMIPLTSNEIVKSPWWCYNISRFTTELIVPSILHSKPRDYCVLIPCDDTWYNTGFIVLSIPHDIPRSKYWVISWWYPTLVMRQQSHLDDPALSHHSLRILLYRQFSTVNHESIACLLLVMTHGLLPCQLPMIYHVEATGWFPDDATP